MEEVINWNQNFKFLKHWAEKHALKGLLNFYYTCFPAELLMWKAYFCCNNFYSQVEGMSMFWNYISINFKINKQKLSNNIFVTFRLMLFHFYNKFAVVGKLKVNSF